ncbi:MAG: transcription antitermination factor NusB [Candidatus Krumholzibacteriota bacterium]
MGKRRKGREIVLQSMYASLISGADLIDTLDDQLTRRESADETTEFARDLAGKVKENAADLDRWLNSLVSSNWDPSRLGSLEIVILTMGLAELKHSPDVPFKVVINEACEMAHRYCEDGAVGFVNGVLDQAAKQVYPGNAGTDAATDEPPGGKDDS